MVLNCFTAAMLFSRTHDNTERWLIISVTEIVNHIYIYQYVVYIYIYTYMFVGCVVLVINKSTTNENNIRHCT